MTNAPAVSRVLRKAGFLPVPPEREGLHVKRGYKPGLVTVVSGLDNEDLALWVAMLAAQTLADEGYTVRLNERIVNVTRED